MRQIHHCCEDTNFLTCLLIVYIARIGTMQGLARSIVARPAAGTRVIEYLTNI